MPASGKTRATKRRAKEPTGAVVAADEDGDVELLSDEDTTGPADVSGISGASASTAISRQEVAGILSAFTERLDASTSSYRDSLMAGMESAIKQIDNKFEHRASSLEHELHGLEQRQNAAEDDNKRLWAAVDSLTKSLAVAEAAGVYL